MLESDRNKLKCCCLFQHYKREGVAEGDCEDDVSRPQVRAAHPHSTGGRRPLCVHQATPRALHQVGTQHAL